MGGETVVHLRGKGLGGRNQEIALSAALGIEGLSNALVFSVGSDGTDGPTDAAGGIADGETAQLMRQRVLTLCSRSMITTPTMRSARSADSSRPARRVRTSMTSPSCCCARRNEGKMRSA